MDFKTGGDIGQRKAIADFRRRVGTIADGGADFDTVGTQDVRLDAVLVLDEGDEDRAVGSYSIATRDFSGFHLVRIAL
jgi:hypothetical protein